MDREITRPPAIGGYTAGYTATRNRFILSGCTLATLSVARGYTPVARRLHALSCLATP